MGEMQINSKDEYNRKRVANGYGPHSMLKMIHQQMLEKWALDEDTEKR